MDDTDAQRDFVSWWLLWGRKEYPSVWDWDARHAAIAMRCVPVGRGLSCPHLLLRILESRADVRAAFPLRDEEDVADFLCWYRVHGPLELDAAPPLPGSCLALTEGPSAREPWSSSGIAVPRIAIALARRVPGLPRDGRHSANAVVGWFETYGRDAVPAPTSPPAPAQAQRRVRRRDGVNLVGFVRGESGLGEDVRMAAAALEAVGVPHALCDVPLGPNIPQRDNALAHRVTDDLPYRVTIYCMSAFDMASLFLARGPEFFAGQYRIGYWPWELPEFPSVWREVFALVDEIWTGSTFTAEAYRTQCAKPVLRLPCPVVLPEVEPVARRELGLHRDSAFVFIYPFDVNSYLARKNPIALVRAFRLAFAPADRDVALVLRVNGEPGERVPGWPELVAACADDSRIRIVSGTLDRQRALGIVAASDCLVSPHRAEGYGRNIAEAVLLGVPVLATGFSGCMDFLAPEEALPFELTPVRAGDYPFGQGLRWAKPSLKDMATRMQQVRQTEPATEAWRLARRLKIFAAAYGSVKTGNAFAARLMYIDGEQHGHDQENVPHEPN